jgi:hypothetical protein
VIIDVQNISKYKVQYYCSSASVGSILGCEQDHATEQNKTSQEYVCNVPFNIGYLGGSFEPISIFG